MLRKALLLGLLMFVVIPAGVLVTEHFRGRTQLAAVLQQLEGRGEVFEFDRLAAPPPPPGTDGMAILIAATQRMTDAGNLLPPGIRLLAPGRALPQQGLAWWPGTRGSNTWADVEAWLGRHEGDLELLAIALERPTRRARLDPAGGFANLRLTHLSPIKSSVTALSLSAAEASQRGDLDAAVADLEAMRTLESDLATEPLLISQLVRVACASIACSRTWAVVHAQPWTEPQLARLQAALPSTRFVEAMVRSLEGERALALQEFRDPSNQRLADVWSNPEEPFGPDPQPDLEMPGNVEEAIGLASQLAERFGGDLRRKVLFPLWRFAWGDHAVAFYLQALDAVLQSQRAAVRRGSMASLEGVEILPFVEPASWYDRLRSPYAAAALKNLVFGAVRGFRVETERALHATGIAVRRHQLHHGRLPESLSELVPRFLDEVPIDRMDGQPLRYRREADGTSFVLWSVGDNAKDDGGDPSLPPDDRSTAFWWRGLDAVWPLPAGPGQIAQWQEGEAVRLAK